MTSNGWTCRRHQHPATAPPTVTYTETLVAASPPVAIEGDYYRRAGNRTSTTPRSAMTSAGSMVAAYTNQPLLTDEAPRSTDANGNHASNIYAEPTGGDDRHGRPACRRLGPTATASICLNAQRGDRDRRRCPVLRADLRRADVEPTTRVDPDSVYNPANYQIYNSNGNLMSGVITARQLRLERGCPDGRDLRVQHEPQLSIPDNKWEVVLSLTTTAQPLANGTYTLKVLNAVPATATSAGQTGLREHLRHSVEPDRLQPDGIGFCRPRSRSAVRRTRAGTRSRRA